jgi:hypothetical protein
MATNWAERLAHLHALYDQGYEQGGKFQECIEQCERTLESGMSPFWRIKTFCILVAACQYDWNEAEVSVGSLTRNTRPSRSNLEF